MTRNELLDWVKFSEIDEKSILEEKFDDAIIGFNDNNFGIVYNTDRIIKILEDEGYSFEETLKYIDDNIYKKNNVCTMVSMYNKNSVENNRWFNNLIKRIKK